MCGQHNVKGTAGDKIGQDIDKRHIPSPRIEIKIPDPPGSRTRTYPCAFFISYGPVGVNYEGHPGSKEHLRIQSAHLFCCNRSLVSGVQYDVENCLMQLCVGPCHMVSAEIAVAMAVPIENPADCEGRGVIRFLQVDDILGYLAEEASSRVELFCCTTMHIRILSDRNRPCCVSNSIGISSSILRTVRTWHRRLFPVSKNEGAPCW